MDNRAIERAKGHLDDSVQDMKDFVDEILAELATAKEVNEGLEMEIDELKDQIQDLKQQLENKQ